MNASETRSRRRFLTLVEGAIAVVATAVTIAAAPAAAPAASGRLTQSLVDRTMSCPTAEGTLLIIAFSFDPRAGAASAAIGTGPPTSLVDSLVGVDTRYAHYTVSSSCRATKARVSFSRRGLTSAGAGSADLDCPAPPRVLLRFRLGFDSSGKPLRGTFVIWSQPKVRKGKKTPRSRPLGFVQWSPKRSVSYYSAACTSQ